VRDQNPLGSAPSTSSARGRSNARYAVVARASAAGILFPLSIVAGYLLGKWIGRALGLGAWPAFLGAALGVAAGFWNLYRLLRGLENREDAG
jgi:putative F0F1-ATPase subunit (Ca2+/Mg2+ transporter)